MRKYVLPNDVTRCPGKGCEIKDNCLRFRQLRILGNKAVYSTVTQFTTQTLPETCAGFISVKESDRLQEYETEDK